MFTGKQYASQAEKAQYDKLKYSQYDCQAFCELVLRDIGARQPNGAVYNWRGSNHIWRDAVSWRGTVEEARKIFGCVPVGSWAFMVSNDGGFPGDTMIIWETLHILRLLLIRHRYVIAQREPGAMV